ncbi:MAG: hypothetical protein EBX41_09120 [Chitinophagia bacterium]|nr:hypothetical protein [Chitinophagia bacterium]
MRISFYDNIVPECNLDTLFISVLLGCATKQLNHQKGCDKVASTMKEKYNDRLCVGIMDNDKRKPNYLAEFNKQDQTIKDFAELYRHKDKNRLHYIIIVSTLNKGIEKFILDLCNDSKINPQTYNLPNDLEGWTALKNAERFHIRKKDIVNLFTEITNSNASAITTMQQWFAELEGAKF